jgi:replication-associated recombination protein RarA
MLRPYTESGVPIERQKKILETIIRNPLESYVFSGPPGVGKTTLLRELENLGRVARPKDFSI